MLKLNVIINTKNSPLSSEGASIAQSVERQSHNPITTEQAEGPGFDPHSKQRSNRDSSSFCLPV